MIVIPIPFYKCYKMLQMGLSENRLPPKKMIAENIMFPHYSPVIWEAFPVFKTTQGPMDAETSIEKVD